MNPIVHGRFEDKKQKKKIQYLRSFKFFVRLEKKNVDTHKKKTFSKQSLLVLNAVFQSSTNLILSF